MWDWIESTAPSVGSPPPLLCFYMDISLTFQSKPFLGPEEGSAVMRLEMWGLAGVSCVKGLTWDNEPRDERNVVNHHFQLVVVCHSSIQ